VVVMGGAPSDSHAYIWASTIPVMLVAGWALAVVWLALCANPCRSPRGFPLLDFVVGVFDLPFSEASATQLLTRRAG